MSKSNERTIAEIERKERKMLHFALFDFLDGRSLMTCNNAGNNRWQFFEHTKRRKERQENEEERTIDET